MESEDDEEYGHQYGDLIKEVKSYFTAHHKFRNGRVIGCGSYGLAIAYEEALDSDPWTRLVVVKAAIDEDSDYSIENEDTYLRAVRGAKHVIRLLYSGPEVLSRMSLVTGYVEHGDWGTVLARFIMKRERIPNRILWGVFLCLTRAAIGMAWPMNGDVNTPEQTETIQNRTPSTLAHLDITLQNVLVGRWMKQEPEHRFSPLTKLIDFANADELPEDKRFGAWTGYLENVSDIGHIMLWLALGHQYHEIQEVKVRNRPGEPLRMIRSRTHYDLTNGRISNELRYLICRCCAVDRSECPQLPELLEICENAVLNHTAADYADLTQPAPRYETDEELDRIIQTYILNGDTE
ncbi:hypothetical protein F4779DRAFT_638404 [Xylariaceae sp. FL0662B]|nr:hypothetical protein F4779DRAFT_638404 [Xylariaceae sp. FL0662B]